MSKNAIETFVADLWEKIFSYLSRVSIFYWLRKVTKNTSYFFVDAWVLGNLFLSFLAVILTYYINIRFKFLFWIILTYGILRVFEIIIYQLNVLFFDRIRAQKKNQDYSIKSATRMVILLLHNFAEIMFWYSSMMICILKLEGNFSQQSTVWDYIRSNILNVATFNSNEIEKIVNKTNSNIANLIFFENITGLFMTLLCLARFINLVPTVKSKDEM
ncbi:hypothetical protein [Caldicellulosiruptor sp. DIB 104C]|uniref:hypothetical protein n=1 Tax=Caldicellulosiruptor sp. DIB 104C TaxID=3019889 RepID=UPI00230563DA|nr:hypothetical protein [Caldicellulosiruptor sp. DIB 104C]